MRRAARVQKALEATPPQTLPLAELMEHRQLLPREAVSPTLGLEPVDRQARPQLLLRCWAAPQTRSREREEDRGRAVALLVTQAPPHPLRRSMAMRPGRCLLPLAQAGRPRRPHRPISEISNRFNLSPQAPLLCWTGAVQLRRPVVSFLLTRSIQ